MPKRLSDAEKRLRQLERHARYGITDGKGNLGCVLVALDHATKLRVEWIPRGMHWRYWTDQRVHGRNTVMRSRQEALAVLGGPDA